MPDKFTSKSIIHVVSSLEVGGAERFVIDLCRLQIGQKMTVAILSFGLEDDTLVSECEKAGINVFFTAKNKMGKWRDAYLSVNAFNIIHFHSPYPLKFMLPIMPLCIRKKIIYTRHGADPLSGRPWGYMHKIARLFVNEVSFVSQEGADVFSRTHGWLRKPKHVIDNGVNLDEVVITRTQNDKTRIGSVGRMIPLKNQICLLKAITLLPEVKRKAVEVHFFGDGPDLVLLKDFVDKNLLQEFVIFHGMVSNRSNIYNSFDILTVTSETEGLSLAIMEAMAYYCPVLASNVGGNSKLVVDESNGYLFDYDDAQKLSDKIAIFIANPELVKAFALKGRSRIEEQFSLEASVEKYQKLYFS